MIRRLTGSVLLQLALGAVIAVPATAQLSSVTSAAAAPVNGFPNWEERVLHQWINRARVEPAVDLEDCGANCSVAEMAASCYTAVAPLMWDYELSVASRFHADSMVRQNFFAHVTPCALRANLAELYPSSCDGSAACACAGSGSSSPSTRVALFGGSYSGEIIAAGYSNPVSAFYGWLLEPVASTAPCAYSSYGSGNTNGHRWLILKSAGSLGSGYAEGGAWGRYYTTDFGGGGAVSPIPSGAHYPRQASTIEFWANWYDDEPPSDARVVVGAISHPMTLERGTSTNGAWSATVSGLGTGCHRYYFDFSDSSGQTVRHPSSGTFGIGPVGSCAEWLDSVVPPPALLATAVSTTSVQVSWTSAPGASQYQLERSVGGVPFAPLATVGSTGYVDHAVVPGMTYLYRARAVGGTAWSNLDHATTIVFQDDSLVPVVMQVRAIHVTQLRSAADAMREAAGLPASSWTDGSPHGSPVKAVHVLELRSSISAALTALGKTATFTNAVNAGAPLRAADLQELRDVVR